MALTVFNRDLGRTQGRTAPKGFVPPEGRFAFVLGDDQAGRIERLAVGDFVEVKQMGSFGDAKLVRLRSRTRPPAAMPAAATWRASLRVDGAELASTVLRPGRVRDRVDLAGNVSRMGGVRELAFRLELVGSPGTLDCELPGLYLDAVLFDPSDARPLVMNRDPEPGEREVPIDTVVTLDVTDVGPDGIDVAGTEVFVAGALAFSAGFFQPGFDGSRSAILVLRPDTARIVIDPRDGFRSQQQVGVRVVSRTVGGGFTLDASWSFTCEDLTAPALVAVQARALTRLRASFSEPVRQAGAEPGDALDPAHYTLVSLTAPAVVPTAVVVEPVTDSSVDVVTDVALSPGAAYQLQVAGVTDVLGNVIASPLDRVSFRAFVPPRPARRRFDLLNLLPAMNRREDDTGDLKRFMSCLQEVTDLVLFDVDRFTDILDPDIAPEPFLDVMLADLGNPFAFDLSAVDKRRLLNVLVEMYREKGSGVGIRNAIRFFLGIEVEILTFTGEGLILGEAVLGEDWVLGPPGAFSTYAFQVIASRVLSAEERRRIRQIVNYMKPAHTHFVRLVEPELPEEIDHLELGRSELGDTWILH